MPFLLGSAGKAAEPLWMEVPVVHRGIYAQLCQRLMSRAQGRFSTGFIWALNKSKKLQVLQANARSPDEIWDID